MMAAARYDQTQAFLPLKATTKRKAAKDPVQRALKLLDISSSPTQAMVNGVLGEMRQIEDLNSKVDSYGWNPEMASAHRARRKKSI